MICRYQHQGQEISECIRFWYLRSISTFHLASCNHIRHIWCHFLLCSVLQTDKKWMRYHKLSYHQANNNLGWLDHMDRAVCKQVRTRIQSHHRSPPPPLDNGYGHGCRSPNQCYLNSVDTLGESRCCRGYRRLVCPSKDRHLLHCLKLVKLNNFHIKWKWINFYQSS